MMNASLDITDPSDSDLLDRCLADRDRDAFAALVARYQNLVCSVAYGIVADRGQSEDVAQETFVVAWRQLSTLREREKFRAWLCGIARHRAHAVVRGRRPESALGIGVEAVSDEPGPDDAAATRDEEALVSRALAELPETYREPLVLFYREDQSVARVAAGLDLSEDAVKQRLSRGRKLLRERVLAMIEETLVRTKPGPAFTLAVMGALPGVLAGSAAAPGTGAGAGAAGKAAAAGALGAAATGALFGTLGGILGALAGCVAGHQSARYQSQRDLLRRFGLLSGIVLGVFSIPWITLGLGWWSPRDLPPGRYLLFWFLWMGGFFLSFPILAWRFGVQSRRLRRRGEEGGEEELPPTPLRRKLQRWQGRRWESRATLLGWPIVSIAFSDADRDFAGYDRGEGGAQLTAKGWIACGDRAVGGLAVGNLAVGGIAFGGVAVGLLSFGGLAAGGVALGGLSVGLLALGGLAIGGGAIGGGALGWLAFGGAAVAWRAALGGFALARDFAVGGEAIGREANSEAAKAYLEGSSFFEFGNAYLAAVQSPWFLPVFLVLLLAGIGGTIAVGFRRREG